MKKPMKRPVRIPASADLGGPVVAGDVSATSSDDSDDAVFVLVPQRAASFEEGEGEMEAEGSFEADSLDEAEEDAPLDNDVDDVAVGASPGMPHVGPGVSAQQSTPDSVVSVDSEDSLDADLGPEMPEDELVEDGMEIGGGEEMYEGDAEIEESDVEYEEDINEVSDPEDLETDTFSQDEAELTGDDELPGELDANDDSELTPGEESSEAEDVDGVDGTAEASMGTTFHDAVESQGESSSDWSGSDLEREAQTVRRTARRRVPKRVLT
jgi:hypothetical protein